MFPKLSIRRKVSLALAGAALAAIALASLGLVLVENLTIQQRVREIIEPYAQLVAVGVETAVAFEDPQRAQEVLETLRANPDVLQAEILLENGNVLAAYSRTGTSVPKAPFEPQQGARVRVSGGAAQFTQALRGGAQLRLTMSLERLSAQTWRSLWAFAAGTVLLVGCTLGILAALLRGIVQPIATLAAVVEEVRARGDYERRVPVSGEDEVARLGRSFNEMLEAIGARARDLRQLTAFQQTILNNAAYGIISTDPDGVVSSFNPSAERLLGYKSDEVIGKANSALWHDPDELALRAQEAAREWNEPISPGFGVFIARARHGGAEEREWTFIRKDGTRMQGLLSVTALRNESGAITGYVGMLSDLTERKKAEEELRQYAQEIKNLNAELEQRVAQRTRELAESEARLRQSNKELEMFSYSVAHDLRTPLRSIGGFSRILLDDYFTRLDSEGQEFLKSICAATVRMGQLIDDLLELSRVSRSEMSLAPVNLSNLARSILDELKATAPDRRVQFEIQPDMVAFGDAILLRVVLENLLDNAWKYTGKQAEARIEFGQAVSQNGQAYFVRDNGAGFDMAYANKLFRPFQRLHSPTDFPGTGIGLATVQRVVDRHGGRAWAEGEVGKGATFYFTLPALGQVGAHGGRP